MKNDGTKKYAFADAQEGGGAEFKGSALRENVHGQSPNEVELRAAELREMLGYRPHRGQAAFHADTARNRWVFGGNRTGKTECGAVEALWRALGVHPRLLEKQSKGNGVGSAECKDCGCTANGTVNSTAACMTNGWVVSLTAQVQRDVAQEKIFKYLKRLPPEWIVEKRHKDGAVDYVVVKNVQGGTGRIGFKTCEQGRERFQGTGLDWVWFDEEPPYDVYEECLMRTLDKRGEVWGTMTPLKGRTWVYQKIFINESGDPSVSLHTFSWFDNPHIDEGEIRRMEHSLGADALESRRDGKFTDGGGLVFSEFSDLNVIDPFEIPNAWYTCISIDPGWTNPTAVLWIAVDTDGKIFVVDEFRQSRVTVAEIAKAIKARTQRLGFAKYKSKMQAFCDTAALQATLGAPESVAEQFAAHGIDVNTDVTKNVQEGIMRLKAAFKNAEGVRKLFIFKNCVHLVRELRGYFWGDNERPIKKNDHCIDALRYFVATAMDERKWMVKPRESVHEREKKKLIRSRRNEMGIDNPH